MPPEDMHWLLPNNLLPCQRIAHVIPWLHLLSLCFRISSLPYQLIPWSKPLNDKFRTALPQTSSHLSSFPRLWVPCQKLMNLMNISNSATPKTPWPTQVSCRSLYSEPKHQISPSFQLTVPQTCPPKNCQIFLLKHGPILCFGEEQNLSFLSEKTDIWDPSLVLDPFPHTSWPSLRPTPKSFKCILIPLFSSARLQNNYYSCLAYLVPASTTLRSEIVYASCSTILLCLPIALGRNNHSFLARNSKAHSPVGSDSTSLCFSLHHLHLLSSSFLSFVSLCKFSLT